MTIKMLTNTKELREKKKEYDKEYAEKNREKIAEKRREKVTCKCGTVVSYSGLSKHRKSQKHKKLMAELELESKSEIF